MKKKLTEDLNFGVKKFIFDDKEKTQKNKKEKFTPPDPDKYICGSDPFEGSELLNHIKYPYHVYIRETKLPFPNFLNDIKEFAKYYSKLPYFLKKQKEPSP